MVTGVTGRQTPPPLSDDLVERCAAMARKPGEPWNAVVRRMLEFAAPAILGAYLARATGGDATRAVVLPDGTAVSGLVLRRVLGVAPES